MKPSKVYPRFMCIATIAVTLAACSANPVNHAMTLALNFDLDSEMTTSVIYASVVFDEDTPVVKLDRMDRIHAYHGGVVYHSQEEHYRMVRVDMRNHFGQWHRYSTIAVVPDSLPLLKRNDVIALRLIKGLDGLLNFAVTKEGTAIVALACKVDTPEWEHCALNLPVPDPKNRMIGPNGVAPIAYLPKLADYGFTFTPRYDDNGNVLPNAPNPIDRASAPVMTAHF